MSNLSHSTNPLTRNTFSSNNYISKCKECLRNSMVGESRKWENQKKMYAYGSSHATSDFITSCIQENGLFTQPHATSVFVVFKLLFLTSYKSIKIWNNFIAFTNIFNDLGRDINYVYEHHIIFNFHLFKSEFIEKLRKIFKNMLLCHIM